MKTNIFFACLFVSGLISAQELTNKKGSEYKFTVVKILKELQFKIKILQVLAGLFHPYLF